MSVHRIEVGPGVELAVREGLGAAPAVVMVHGLASNARLWDRVAAGLDGLRSIRPDMRGHGESDRPENGYDFDTVSADLHRVVTILDAPEPVVVGQSWGANVALHYAARHPVRSVVLVDGGFIELGRRFDHPDRAWEVLAPPSYPPATLADVRRWIETSHPEWEPEAVTATLANLETDDAGRVRNRLARDRHRRIIDAMWHHRPTTLAVTAPVHLIAAEEDGHRKAEKAADIDRLAAALPDLRVTWMDGHHDLHAERPDEIAAVIREAAS